MAQLIKRRDKYYARIRKWNGITQDEIQIPLRTTFKAVALDLLKDQRYGVNKFEADIKSGVIGSDRASLKKLFPWLNEDGTSTIPRLTVAEAVSQWIESQRANGKRPRTLAINQTALIHFIGHLTSNHPVENIFTADLDDFREVYSPERGHSPTTTNMYLRSINTFLNWLEHKEFIEKKPKVIYLDVDEPEVKYFTEPEIADLLGLDLSRENAHKNGTWVENWEHYRRAFQFYLNTGCRLREPFIGEIKGLWLVVTPDKSKNRRKRVIRLDNNTLETVKEMRGRVAKCLNLKWATDKYTKNLRVACRILDIKEKRTVHSLRHTYGCIRRLQTNGNMPLIRDEMGHTNIATTERYCNIPLEMLEEHFPSYAKQAENDVRDTLIRDTEPSEVEVASR